MSSILFSSSFTLYDFPAPFHYPAKFKLSDLCCDQIVKDDEQTKYVLEVIQDDLKESLLKAALKGNRDKCVEEIIKQWPYAGLLLNKIMPPVFNTFKPIYSCIEMADSTRKAIKYTTCLVHTFLELFKKKTPTKLNALLDLSDYPSGFVGVSGCDWVCVGICVHKCIFYIIKFSNFFFCSPILFNFQTIYTKRHTILIHSKAPPLTPQRR